MTTRRAFLQQAAAALAPTSSTPQFKTDATALQSKYDAALRELAANVRPVHRYSTPVLIEGATYIGIWLECGPTEGLVYAPISNEVARANHDAFFTLQREDGYLPCNVKE